VLESILNLKRRVKMWCMVPFASILLVGCATTNTPKSIEKAKDDSDKTATSQVEAKVIEVEGVGVGFIEPEVDLKKLTKKEIQLEASGVGFPSEIAKTNFQKKITALEAAKYRALVALLEKINGITVSKDVKVIDMVFSGEKVEVTTNGNLEAVFIVSEDYNPETEVATVTVAKTEVEEPQHLKVEQKKDSLELKKEKAVAAAKALAIGNLKAKLGKTYAQQKTTVENMELSNQISQTYIEGALKNVQFSQPRWLNDTMCEVIARVEVALAK